MTRRLLTATMTLGLLITGMGSSGTFAVFTDRATGGPNQVTSGEEPRAAELEMAHAASPQDCAAATFTDDLVTGSFDATGVTSGWESGIAYMCLRNAGVAELTVTGKVIDVVDEEVACTGDEAANGDASCGTGAGELAEVLVVNQYRVACDTGAPETGLQAALPYLATTGMPYGTLAPGAMMCLQLQASFAPAGFSNLLMTQLAQSDRVTWRFAFDGVTV